jgi:hypothetical protein
MPAEPSTIRDRAEPTQLRQHTPGSGLGRECSTSRVFRTILMRVTLRIEFFSVEALLSDSSR